MGNNDEITVTSTTDTPEAVEEALAVGTEPDTGDTETLEEPGNKAEQEAPRDDDGDGEDDDSDSDEGEPPAADDEQDAAKPRRRRGGQRTMQQRIDTLTWQINRERAEREELQRQLEWARNPQAQQPQQPQQPTFEEPEPNINNFETLEDWQREVAAWNRRYTKWELQQELDQRLNNVLTPERVQVAQIQQTFKDNLDAYRAENPEFQKLAQKMLDEGVPTTPLMNEHFVRSGEMGPKIMHYLALNPDECRRIAALPQGPQLVALGKVESKIEAGALSAARGNGKGTTAPPAAQNRQRNQQPPPEPPNPVGARGGNAPKNVDNMSYAEYKQWRRTHGR